MLTRTGKSLTGTWVHQADGDNFPTELTMAVIEETGAFSIIAWRTETTGHPAPFGPTGCTFTYGEGAATILMAMRRPDGTWSPPHPMDADRWHVQGRNIAGARERLREFFTELGYTKKEK